MDRLIQCGREFGLEGKELHQFIEAQQIIKRDERAESRRVELAKLEFKVAIEKEKKEILEKERLKIQAVLELKNEGVDMSMNFQGIDGRQRAKGPKLPTFVDVKDDLDSYLKRFERFAISNGWERREWATALSALLTGIALDVYSRLPDDTAFDYEKVKEALLIRYQLTKEGFKKRYRESDPKEGETASTVRQMYKSLVEPHFRYCCPVWGNVGETSLTKLQKLQNRAARIVTGSRYDQSALPLIRALGWPTVREILDLETLKMVFKSLNSDAPSYMSDMLTRVSETTSRALRNSNINLRTPMLRTSAGQGCFSFREASLWNGLQNELKGAPTLRKFQEGLIKSRKV